MLKRNRKSKKGFSLIEIIAVVAIMAILLVVLSPVLLQYTEKSRTQRDVSALDEVVNAVQVGLSIEKVYDEIVQNSVSKNASCYIDTSRESEHPGQAVGTSNLQYTFIEDARVNDQTPYYAAGNMNGVTVTFEPVFKDEGVKYVLEDGVVNKFSETNNNQKLSDLPNLHDVLKQTVGDELEQISQTYKNSEYTVFIDIGTNAAKNGVNIYGQYSGTNLGSSTVTEYVYQPAIDKGTTEDINTNYGDGNNGESGDGEGTVTDPTESTSPSNPTNPTTPTPPVEGGGTVVINHNYGEPTWVWNGVESAKATFTCTDYNCTQSQTVDATITDSTEPATCGKDGKTVYTATVTFKEKQYTDKKEIKIDKTGEHHYTESVTPPTCTEKGFTTYTCACGDIYTGNETAATGHAYSSKVTKEPTCTVKGEKTLTCKCGDVKVEPINELPHNYNKVVTAPTCTEKGYTTYTCSCGDTYIDDETDMIEHSFGGDYKKLNDGEHYRECIADDCDARDVQTHNYVEIDRAEPTCTEEGCISWKCEDCGDTYNTAIDAVKHNYEATVVPPTCTAGGYTEHECSKCGDKYTDTETDKIDHDYTSVITEPTCVKRGYTTYTCDCGYSYIGDYTDATGHNYEGEVIIDPTCENDGIKTYTCKVCSDFYNEPVDALGHIDTNGDTTCDRCGKGGIIPDGATYKKADGTVLTGGNAFPETATNNDVYTYGDYKYVYYFEDESYGTGWNVKVIDKNKTDEYGPILVNINKTQVTSMNDTFEGCVNMEIAPAIPIGVTDLSNAFKNCTKLTDVQTIPSNVKNMSSTFENCTSLTTVPAIPGAVEDMSRTFFGCTSLTGTITINAAEPLYEDCFKNTYKSIYLDGTSTKLAELARTDGFDNFSNRDNVRVLPAACNHSYNGEVTAPTCTEKGYTTYKCSICGNTYVSDETDMIEHPYGEWVVTTKPCCTTDGEKRRDCTACEHYETDVIAQTGHDYKSVITAPTCTEDGYTTNTCANCGDSYVDGRVDAYKHLFEGQYEKVNDQDHARTCKRNGCSEKEVKKHIYVPNGGANATCEGNGYTSWICHDCTDTYNTDIAPLGHNYEATVIAPTCTEKGYTEHVCSKCGDTYTDTEVDPTGHSYTGQFIELDNKQHYRECDNGCKTRETADHTFVHVSTEEVSCVEDGNKHYECNSCTATKDEAIDALGHIDTDNDDVCDRCPASMLIYFTINDLTNQLYDMSCQADLEMTWKQWLGSEHNVHKYVFEGTTIYLIGEQSSVVCNITDKIVDNGVYGIMNPNSIEHSYTGEYIKLDDNQHYRECDHDCGTREILDHVFEKTGTTEAKCETAGATHYKCKDCGATKDEPVAATGHKYSGNYTRLNETQHYRECDNGCKTKQIANHEYKQTGNIESTCTEDGCIIKTCEGCGDSYNETVKATGHNYEDTVIAPTCTEKGYIEYKCSKCGDTYTDSEVSELGHSYYDSEQYDENSHMLICSECGHKLQEGHLWGPVDEVHPTCTEDGYEKRVCDECGYEKQKVLSATGHNYVETVIEPTCTENGYTEYLCSKCGDTYKEDETDAVGHDYKYNVTKEPTCTESGNATYNCENCDDSYEEVLDATGHKDNNSDTVCDNCGITISTIVVHGLEMYNYCVEITAPSNLTWKEILETGNYTLSTDGANVSISISGENVYATCVKLPEPLPNVATIVNANDIFGSYSEYWLKGKNGNLYGIKIETEHDHTDDNSDGMCDNCNEYVLSGVWEFNDILDMPSTTISQNINYYYITEMGNIIQCDSISIASKLIDVGAIYPVLGGDVSSYPFKTLYFGTDLQPVSEEFYNWFKANATQENSSDEGELKTIQLYGPMMDSVYITAPENLTWEEILESGNYSINSDDITLSIYGEYVYATYNSMTEPAPKEVTEVSINDKFGDYSEYYLKGKNGNLYGLKITNESKDLNIVTQVNGVVSTDVVYFYDKSGSEYEFVYCGDGELVGWELSEMVEGSHYEIVDEYDETIIINLLVDESELDDLVINALVEVEHEHSYTESITTAATCTQAGVKTFTCSCGDSYTESITKLEHSYTGNYTKMNDTQHCRECDNGCGTQQTANHTYVKNSEIAPTCTEDGCIVWKCYGCNDSYNTVDAATGHIDDVKDNKCDKCGLSLGDSEYVLSGTWKFKDDVVLYEGDMEQQINFTSINTISNTQLYYNKIKLSCVFSNEPGVGYTQIIEYYTENDMYGHSARDEYGWDGDSLKTITFTSEQPVSEEFYNWFKDNATQVSGGEDMSEMITLPIDGKWPSAKITAHCNLTWKEILETGNYTLSDSNIKLSISGDNVYATYTEFTEPLEDDYIAVNISDKFSDYSRYGIKGKSGNLCGIKNESSNEPEHTHSYTESITTAATCTKAGVKTFICSCGDSYTESIAALGHSNKTVTTAATCTTDGSIVTTCSRCGDSSTTVLKATGHKDDIKDNKCDKCGAKLTVIDGIGSVESDDPNTEFTYDPESGTISGVTPPENNKPETPPDIPEESLKLIEFGLGEFESKTNYTPGTYETIEYEYSVTTTKYPVSYLSINYSYWLVDEDEKIIEPLEATIDTFDKEYSTYVVYNANTGATRTLEGQKAKSLMIYAINNDGDDTLENAIYLAAYLNKSNGTKDCHLAQWNGSKYVAINKDAEINAVIEFTKTEIRTATRTVEVTKPSSSTEYVYTPSGTMKAVDGMTWRQWLNSGYNTTGITEPIIKTDNFEDVDYDDVIEKNKNYGFVTYNTITISLVDDLGEGQITANPDATWSELIESGLVVDMVDSTVLSYTFSVDGTAIVANTDAIAPPGLNLVLVDINDRFGDYSHYALCYKNSFDIGYLYGVPVAKTITFTIDGKEYQAEEDMTWEEWISSTYCTSGKFSIFEFNIDVNRKYVAYGEWNNEYDAFSNNRIFINELTPQFVDDTIVANGQYTVGIPDSFNGSGAN